MLARSRCSLDKSSWKVNPSLATAVNALATASMTFERRLWRRFRVCEDAAAVCDFVFSESEL